MPQKEYESLCEESREIAVLKGASSLLHWDQETYMPAKAAPSRAEQLALISRMIHEKLTGKRFRNALEKLVDLESGKVRVGGLRHEQRAALREWRRDYLLASKIPESFVKHFAELTSEALEVWKLARQDSAFGRFAPYLEQIVHLCREKADYLGFEESPYDALLDEFEPGMTKARLSRLFGELVAPVSKLRRSLLQGQSARTAFLFQRYPERGQMQFARKLLTAVGFDEEHARLDLTTHPFCISPHPTDGRLTTRVNVNDPMANFLAALHEGGHYLYEHALPVEQFGTPLGQALSLGLHESQSRLWETRIGQSLAFWKHYFPALKAQFPKNLEGVGVKTFYRAINQVTKTPIRVESDEVSYCLHVALRFDLECALIEGTISVADLPEAWNEKMRRYLDITPKDDAEGCLQDIHWSLGALGYFPTYALGNLYAAHFFAAFEKDHADWEARIAQGDCAFLREWLRDRIHIHGKRFTAEELLKRVCGCALSCQPYLKYLKEKYRSL